jgi:hypothetical protein
LTTEKDSDDDTDLYFALRSIEDQKLDADEEPPVGRGSAWDDGEEEEPARRPLSHAKATLSKRQMSFISPRLGVLNNSASIGPPSSGPS